MSKKESSGWGKFVLGAIVGGTIGILFAPKKGSETRKELKAKADELIAKAKEIDIQEVKEKMLAKIEEIVEEVQDLDKEKVKEIAIEKAQLLKAKCEDLVAYAKEKGTPVVEKLAKEMREKAIIVTKDVLKKLEDE